MEAIKKRFKIIKDPVKIVILRDMWPTGFDVPCAQAMYMNKVMKGHGHMQAIARVNRVFEDKPNGLVVDYIRISGILAEATKKYTRSGGEGKPTIDKAAAVVLCLDQFEKVKTQIGGLEVESIAIMSNAQKLSWSNALVNSLLASDPVTDVFLHEERKLSELAAMNSSDERIWEIQKGMGIIQKILEAIRKIKIPPGLKRKKNEQIKDLSSKSLESQKIVDLTAMYDLDKIDISIIDDRFQAMVRDWETEDLKARDQLLAKVEKIISKQS